MRKLIPSSLDEPRKMDDAFQRREARMHHCVDQIHDAGLRENADAVVNLDDQMLDVWRKTIPDQSPEKDGSDGNTASKDLRSASAEHAPQRHKVAETMPAACTVSS
jgi:hypothetical protein